jgi:hypothetical protein
MEHGIIFNRPYTNGSSIEVPQFTKNRQENMSQNYSGAISQDQQQLLIPIAVVGDRVFCHTLQKRTSATPTEWRNPTYQGGQPQPYYIQETEYVSFYGMPLVKDFIEFWKLVE